MEAVVEDEVARASRRRAKNVRLAAKLGLEEFPIKSEQSGAEVEEQFGARR